LNIQTAFKFHTFYDLKKSYVYHEVEKVNDYVFIHAQHGTNPSSKKLFCLEVSKNQIPSIPYEVPTLASFREILSTKNLFNPFGELFHAQLFIERVRDRIRVLQFNMAAPFQTFIEKKSSGKVDFTLSDQVLRVLACAKCVEPPPEVDLKIIASTRSQILPRQVEELDSIEMGVNFQCMVKSRPEIDLDIGHSGMRRRVGRVLKLTFEPLSSDEVMDRILNCAKLSGEINALYGPVVEEETKSKVLLERQKARESMLLNRSRFEASQTGVELELEEKIEENESSDTESAYGSQGVQKRKKQKTQDGSQANISCLDLSIVGPVDSLMEATVEEKSSIVKSESKSKVKKKKKKRKSTLGF